MNKFLLFGLGALMGYSLGKNDRLIKEATGGIETSGVETDNFKDVDLSEVKPIKVDDLKKYIAKMLLS